ncbi:MAG: ABC transporter ATP-binding protein [Pseudonocardiales bacterium]|nr:MAG: ABC transporter ATP-binding protein [Pseudonocardiales bacterium]
MTFVGEHQTGKPQSTVLAVEDLSRSFGGVPAVDGVSFRISGGEIVGLIGPNGSGKSTTVNLVSGSLRCDSGRILLRGSDISNRSAYQVARLGLTRTFQIPRVWGRLTVAENLLVAGTDVSDESATRALTRRRKLRQQRGELEERLFDILATLNLTPLANQQAEVLSGGQKRLLEFGRIMMSGASVLVLDEPFAGVNPVMCRALQDIIEALRADGCLVLLIEHNLQAVEETCDRVIVMATGKIIAQGSLAEVRASEKVISAYLGQAS